MVTRNRRTRVVLVPGYVTAKEFSDMQTDLKEQLDEQKEVLKAALKELRKIKAQLILAVGSESIDDDEDEEEE